VLAVLCAFALGIEGVISNTQRKGAKDRKAREGLTGKLVGHRAKSFIMLGMPNRQIGVEVLIEDHFWNDAQDQYVYSFHCPACNQLRLTPDLGIYRCDCGSWLIVTNQK
jgi:hypothetical protein